MIGWGVAQYPWMLVDEVTIKAAAGTDATLDGLLVVVGLAGVIVVPALTYLFWLTQSERWNETHKKCKNGRFRERWQVVRARYRRAR